MVDVPTKEQVVEKAEEVKAAVETAVKERVSDVKEGFKEELKTKKGKRNVLIFAGVVGLFVLLAFLGMTGVL